MTSFVLVKAPNSNVSRLDDFIKPHASSYHWYDTEHGYRLLLWALTHDDTAHYYSDPDIGFVAAVGTVLYAGLEGQEALSAFLRDFNPAKPALNNPTGHFALCVQKAGVLMVLNDRLGAWKLYRHEAGNFISAGVLETLLLDEKPVFSKQGVHEYVFNGHPLGQQTLLASTKALLPGEGVQLKHHALEVLRSDHMPLARSYKKEIGSSLEEASDQQLELLSDVLKSYSGLKGKVTSSLSGGYDSRLMLAGFLSEGITPDVFVYGADGDADVVSAKAVSDKAGLPIRHIDKNLGQSPLPELDQLLLYFDGWPEDGLALAPRDLEDRRERAKVAPFMANGSGGEIYRHFFLYPNTAIKKDAFLSATYGRINPSILRTGFDKAGYQQKLGASFNLLMGHDDEMLSREQIDLVYSNVRLTHEKARDIIINNRFQKVLYPFMEFNVVAGSRTIPFGYRQYGRLEAKMNARMNPDLASVPCEYGFNFLDGPSLAHSIKRCESYYRPLWLRRTTPVLKGLAQKGVPAAALVGDIALHLKNKKCPNMETYFKVDAIKDPITASRIVTLELLAERFGIALR